MKISPVVHASGTPGQNVGGAEVGRSSDPVKMERARAIARGEKVPEVETLEPKERQNTRTIKMRTQQSVYRDGETGKYVPVSEVETPVETQSSTLGTSEEAAEEVTQPLSPQFAALAKQKRALQVKERELEAREKALGEGQVTDGSPDLIARLKAEPLRVLQEAGVSYDQLTEAILNGDSGLNPDIQALKAEIRALKEGVDKTLVDRDTAAEQAALNEMRKEADRLAKEGDTFELVRETNSLPQVIDLIHRTYKQTGEVLDVPEAMQLVEDELIKESLKLAGLKKVQGRLAPPVETAPLPSQPQKQMRTLTARDTATPSMDRRARAIAAALGTLRK